MPGAAPLICRWVDLPDPATAEAAIERIFFAASGTQSFASLDVRTAFRERWLGRYLTHDPDQTLVSLAPGRTITGYLVGALDDPARAHRFADIGYFQVFAPVTARFPAHLHVNLDASARGSGVGSQLVEAFCERARSAGSPGVHVVTGKGVRNVGFYERLGFNERASTLQTGREVVLLGRVL